LKTIENEIITIYQNENKERLINARELHKALNVGKDFTSWIKGRIVKYGFVENRDYLLTFTKIGERN